MEYEDIFFSKTTITSDSYENEMNMNLKYRLPRYFVILLLLGFFCSNQITFFTSGAAAQGNLLVYIGVFVIPPTITLALLERKKTSVKIADGKMNIYIRSVFGKAKTYSFAIEQFEFLQPSGIVLKDDTRIPLPRLFGTSEAYQKGHLDQDEITYTVLGTFLAHHLEKQDSNTRGEAVFDETETTLDLDTFQQSSEQVTTKSIHEA